jgi:UDP-N-acetylmuramyl pentapeptide synthase
MDTLDSLYGQQISTKYDSSTEYLIRLNLEKIRQNRLKYDIPVIGITGSNGKTITKAMLRAILDREGLILETPMNCESSITVTSTIRKLNDSYRYALIEFGIQGEEKLERAVHVTQPTIGIVTNVGEAHLAYLRNRYNVAAEKSELIRHLPNDGFAILNKDDELASEMAKISPTENIIRFGLSRKADFFATDIKSLGKEGTSFKLNHTYDVKMRIFSISDVYNALAAIAAARVIGISFEDIFDRLSRFNLPEGRGRLIEMDGHLLLDDLYDHSITSARKAVQTLLGLKKSVEKTGLILGDLEEYEGEMDEAFRSFGHYLSVFSFDYFFFIGKNAGYFAEGVKTIPQNKEIFVFETIKEAEETLLERLSPGSIFLLKGKIGCDVKFFIDKFLKKVA